VHAQLSISLSYKSLAGSVSSRWEEVLLFVFGGQYRASFFLVSCCRFPRKWILLLAITLAFTLFLGGTYLLFVFLSCAGCSLLFPPSVSATEGLLLTTSLGSAFFSHGSLDGLFSKIFVGIVPPMSFRFFIAVPDPTLVYGSRFWIPSPPSHPSPQSRRHLPVFISDLPGEDAVSPFGVSEFLLLIPWSKFDRAFYLPRNCGLIHPFVLLFLSYQLFIVYAATAN